MSDTAGIMENGREEPATTLETLTRRLERVEAELMLLRAERTALRIEAGMEATIPEHIARRVFVEDIVPIRAFREWRGLTQEELARKVGSSKSYVSQLETRRRMPGVKTLRRIAEALDVPVELLME